MGSDYLIDHIVMELEANQNDVAYRNYVCDLLKAIAESWGARISSRFEDIVRKPQENEKTADEIVLEVMRRGGLKGKAE